MPRIFISYRREETAYPAGWLFDRLGERFGADQVFKDVDSIDPGDDYVQRINTAVGSCDVLLALIGDEWLTITDDDGRRRLEKSDDFVRVEIEAALGRGVRVIPVLVDGATMPDAEELPPSLAALARRQALELSPNRFEFDTDRLLAVLEKTDPNGERPAAVSGERRADEAASRAVDRSDASGRRLSKHTLISVGVAVAAALALGTLLVVLFRPSSDNGAGEPGESWTAQANEICERANESIDALPEPSMNSLETLGADALVGYGDAALAANKRMVRDLGELSPPPEQRADAQELVFRGARMTEAAEELFAALRVGDLDGVQRQQRALSNAGKAFDAKALEVGATTCAEGASLNGVSLPTG
ncbi:MAG TPA: toll/interleukin-1 receptor domain-containing protein [Gaiellaceae bacterium]|nr:toll/interleukin-1 receptor domain-containing protein [Gaiellaceae bacterium]